MKDRGKAVEADDGNKNNYYPDYNYSCSSDLPCNKHPSSSGVGICAQCLKDRLVKLVCSDCGEQRLSSCSCSDISSSYRNSSCTMEVGSVGRISFLIENEKNEPFLSNSKPPKKDEEGLEEVILLKRSNSCCVEVKKSHNGLWKIGRFFKNKMVKGSSGICDYMDVSRSRSLCSFRGSVGHFNETDQEGSEFAYSSAKISDVNEPEPRKSGVKKGNGVMEVEIASHRSAFPVKESDFRGMDESGFIDLKLDLSTTITESKTEYSAFKKSESPLSASDFALFKGEKFLEHIESGGSFGSERGLGVFGNGGSCRITVNNDRGIKKGSKGHKVWKWIFKSHPGWRSSSRKKDVNALLKS